MQLFEQLNEAIDTRYTMIDRAVEAARDVLASQETFKERMEEALDAVKETVEDIVDGDDEDDADESEADES
jgi:F0F1-type ATP synthase membrane subunit b/b'